MKAAATRVLTYDCRKVIITLGSHMVVGKADDNFITIAKQGDGITTNVGCDSSEERSMDPNEQYKLTLVIQQTSPTTEFLENQYAYDNDTCEGMFPVLVKDLRGGEIFRADQAWVVKPPDFTRGKATANRTWEIDTGAGVIGR